MKKLLTFATFVACLAYGEVKAQTVNGKRLNDIDVNYIEVKGHVRPFSDKILISLEYGQVVRTFDDVVIKDDNGKRMEFDSLIGFVNHSKNYGYELFQTYSEQFGKEEGRSVYILKKK